MFRNKFLLPDAMMTTDDINSSGRRNPSASEMFATETLAWTLGQRSAFRVRACRQIGDADMVPCGQQVLPHPRKMSFRLQRRDYEQAGGDWRDGHTTIGVAGHQHSLPYTAVAVATQAGQKSLLPVSVFDDEYICSLEQLPVGWHTIDVYIVSDVTSPVTLPLSQQSIVAQVLGEKIVVQPENNSFLIPSLASAISAAAVAVALSYIASLL